MPNTARSDQFKALFSLLPDWIFQKIIRGELTGSLNPNNDENDNVN